MHVHVYRVKIKCRPGDVFPSCRKLITLLKAKVLLDDIGADTKAHIDHHDPENIMILLGRTRVLD